MEKLCEYGNSSYYLNESNGSIWAGNTELCDKNVNLAELVYPSTPIGRGYGKAFMPRVLFEALEKRGLLRG